MNRIVTTEPRGDLFYLYKLNYQKYVTCPAQGYCWLIDKRSHFSNLTGKSDMELYLPIPSHYKKGSYFQKEMAILKTEGQDPFQIYPCLPGK